MRICSIPRLRDVDHGTAPVGVFATDEHPVLVAQFGGADRVFWRIPLKNWIGNKCIELDSRMTSVRREGAPPRLVGIENFRFPKSPA